MCFGFSQLPIWLVLLIGGCFASQQVEISRLASASNLSLPVINLAASDQSLVSITLARRFVRSGYQEIIRWT